MVDVTFIGLSGEALAQLSVPSTETITGLKRRVLVELASPPRTITAVQLLWKGELLQNAQSLEFLPSQAELQLLQVPGQPVLVALRCRPPNRRERDMGCELTLTVESQIGQVTSHGDADSPLSIEVDVALDPHASQEEVFNSLGKELVDGVFAGVTGTILSYGQTGTGKSHTIIGSSSEADGLNNGLWTRAGEQIARNIAASDATRTKYVVRISIMELYCDRLRDLLVFPRSDELRLREDEDSGVYAEQLTEQVVHSKDEFSRLLDTALRHRTMDRGSSSGSYLVLQAKVEEYRLGTDVAVRSSALRMVDSGGSERISKTEFLLSHARLLRRSFIGLQLVVQALTDPRAKYVPYRDSKLTRLLKDGLGGSGALALIASVSPSHNNDDETRATMRFAARMRQVINYPVPAPWRPLGASLEELEHMFWQQ